MTERDEQRHKNVPVESNLDTQVDNLPFSTLTTTNNSVLSLSRETTMIFTLLSSLFKQAYDVTPPGLVTCLACAYIGSGRYFAAYRHEFIGTLLMIGFTFSPGNVPAGPF